MVSTRSPWLWLETCAHNPARSRLLLRVCTPFVAELVFPFISLTTRGAPRGVRCGASGVGVREGDARPAIASSGVARAAPQGAAARGLRAVVGSRPGAPATASPLRAYLPPSLSTAAGPRRRGRVSCWRWLSGPGRAARGTARMARGGAASLAGKARPEKPRARATRRGAPRLGGARAREPQTPGAARRARQGCAARFGGRVRRASWDPRAARVWESVARAVYWKL